MYCIYGCIQTIPTHRVYRLYDTIVAQATLYHVATFHLRVMFIGMGFLNVGTRLARILGNTILRF